MLRINVGSLVYTCFTSVCTNSSIIPVHAPPMHERAAPESHKLCLLPTTYFLPTEQTEGSRIGVDRFAIINGLPLLTLLILQM